jgi:hypothetical protein
MPAETISPAATLWPLFNSVEAEAVVNALRRSVIHVFPQNQLNPKFLLMHSLFPTDGRALLLLGESGMLPLSMIPTFA